MTGRPTDLDRPVSVHALRAVDNTDWLKTVAIVLVAIDHTGYFFIQDAAWWSVFGRLAAPVFFFLIGYAQSRRVPLSWIGLGIILTLLESWNADWNWVSPNILLSFVLIRLVRPHAEAFARRHGWLAVLISIGALLSLLPFTTNAVDYGSAGWLWALFGLYQRMHADDRNASAASGIAGAEVMRLLACLAAMGAHLWQEQAEYAFTLPQFIVFATGLCALSVALWLFHRGPSPVQPPGILNRPLRFVGRHTLEIYALQLGLSEIAVGLYPDLAG